MCPSQESLSAVYLSPHCEVLVVFADADDSIFAACVIEFLSCVFSDYMNIEEYFEEDEEPPLLLRPCLSDCKYDH